MTPNGGNESENQLPPSELGEESAAQFARMVGRFYRELREQGIPVKLCAGLTHSYMMQEMAIGAEYGD